jgi:hypothetical protein
MCNCQCTGWGLGSLCDTSSFSLLTLLANVWIKWCAWWCEIVGVWVKVLINHDEEKSLFSSGSFIFTTVLIGFYHVLAWMWYDILSYAKILNRVLNDINDINNVLNDILKFLKTKIWLLGFQSSAAIYFWILHCAQLFFHLEK